MISPRRLVYQTLEFQNPARAPRQLWLLPCALERHPEMLAKLRQDFPDDIVHCGFVFKQPPKTSGDAFKIGQYIDEWGCVFENRQNGIIGEVKRPLIADWSDLDKLREPQEVLSVDIDSANAFCRQTDKFVLSGCCPRPFERLQFLRGTENVMMDLAMRPAEFWDLLNRLHQFFLKELELWSKTEVDALLFMDDWGAQRSLLISPQTWREVFKPLYKDYIDLAHSAGKKIFMHSDGYILDIIGDLVELGLDALNAQIFCMGVEQIGQRFAGKITFWGEIDRQHLLPHGSRQDIEQAVQQVKRHLWRDGGCIAQCEFGPGANPDNVWAVFNTWQSLF